MKVVGLTGTIGSGKSAVAAEFSKLGASIVDADELARIAVRPGSSGLAKIVGEFGQSVLNSDGTLDRAGLGEQVFNSAEKRQRLEAILHPEIRLLHNREIERFRSAGVKLVIAVIPLLFEVGGYDNLDSVIVVSAPSELCIARIMKRDACSRELAVKKLESQLSNEQKVSKADFVIDNSLGFSELKGQVAQIAKQLVD